MADDVLRLEEQIEGRAAEQAPERFLQGQIAFGERGQRHGWRRGRDFDRMLDARLRARLRRYRSASSAPAAAAMTAPRSSGKPQRTGGLPGRNNGRSSVEISSSGLAMVAYRADVDAQRAQHQIHCPWMP